MSNQNHRYADDGDSGYDDDAVDDGDGDYDDDGANDDDDDCSNDFPGSAAPIVRLLQYNPRADHGRPLVCVVLKWSDSALSIKVVCPRYEGNGSCVLDTGSQRVLKQSLVLCR